MLWDGLNFKIYIGFLTGSSLMLFYPKDMRRTGISLDPARKVCQEWMSRRTLRLYDQRHGPLFQKLCLIILIEYMHKSSQNVKQRQGNIYCTYQCLIYDFVIFGMKFQHWNQGSLVEYHVWSQSIKEYWILLLKLRKTKEIID